MKLFKMKKLALALGSLAVLGIAGQAQAVGVFTVNPLAPGVSTTTVSSEHSFQADYIGGTSSELLHNTSSGSTASGYLQFGSFTLNGSATGLSAFTTGLNGVYNLYLTFQLVANGPIGSPQSLQSLNFQVFLDPQYDDTFNKATVNKTANTGTEASVTTGGNDVLIGFGQLSGGGSATLNSGGVALNALNSFALCTGAGTAKVGNTAIPGVTSDGTSTFSCAASPTGITSPAPGAGYFTSPNPFYSLVFSQFNNTADGVTQSNDGSLAAIAQAGGGVSFIPVPEPESLGLLGIASVGMALALRRRKAA